MWSIWRDGLEHRLDDVPLADLLSLERTVGTDLDDLNPRANASHARALALLLVGDTDIRLTDVRRSTDDRPTVWSDGKPSGGRTLDGAIAHLCRPPWCYTPAQVRNEFTLRDLQLIGDASG